MSRFRNALLFVSFLLCFGRIAAESQVPPAPNCYVPIPEGWRIRLTADANAPQLKPGSQIGVINTGLSDYGAGHSFASLPGKEDPRLHRRPLYPPADKSLIWTKDERAKFPQCAFRPLVVAYNEPRFLFDYHSAGGLLGHLFIGLTSETGASKWFHQWTELDVQYVEGRMVYIARDAAFPGIQVKIEAAALAESVGLTVKVSVDGLDTPARLTWAYGGASAFFTNYAMTDPAFTFSPPQCDGNRVSWLENRFELRRSFAKTDSIMEQAFAATRFIPDWEAVIQGGDSWHSKTGFGDPNAFTTSPAPLDASTEWTPHSGGKQTGRVVVAEVDLTREHHEGFVLVGMGGNIKKAIKSPKKAWEAALARNSGIASRIVTHTPDSYLDAAVPMMTFATDGTWGDSAVVHGGWSWRFGYLGWRTWYAMDCAGWTERIKKSIQNHATLGRVKSGPDEGALSSMLDTPGGVFYNMNEVFLDHVRHYFDYTNDLALMREIFPVLKGVVAWEDRRLQPGNENLYENALNTWISDSHWYIQSQCTQASAYMLGAHRLLADLARRLGEDPKPFADKAEAISKAMQDKLWMRREGVFAECLDTRGARLLHTEPELPTLYHSAEFGAADPFQIYQMLHWADMRLKTESTPGGGTLYWSSNWFPNNGRSYTHSTHEMAYGEELNFALTNYLGGRADEAYALLRATLCGIFNGPTPGGLSCHAFADGRQRANDEFADASSMWVRTVTEGLFGIVPKLQDGYIQVTPQFPTAWNNAAIETPLFAYSWKRTSDEISIEWKSKEPVEVHFRIPSSGSDFGKPVVDGRIAAFRVEGGIGVSWVVLMLERTTHGSLRFHYASPNLPAVDVQHLTQGADCEIRLPKSSLSAFQDPQGVLENARIEVGVLKGRVVGNPGPGLVFLARSEERLPTYIPMPLVIESATPPPPPKVWAAPQATGHDLGPWTLIDLAGTFNATILDALEKVSKEATPPPPGTSTVGFDYWKSHLSSRHHGDPVQVPSDTAWRAKIGNDGIAWTTDGIPFKSPKEGPNIGIVTQTGGFPTAIEFPLDAQGKSLYLMLSGMSFPVQSHVPHLRLTLAYANGDTDTTDLTPPLSIGDCWSTWCGHWHDTAANGFENLGGRFGPAGSSQVPDLTKPINVDTEAHLVAFDLRNGVAVKSVRIEAVANDVIFGVMGATVLK